MAWLVGGLFTVASAAATGIAIVGTGVQWLLLATIGALVFCVLLIWLLYAVGHRSARSLAAARAELASLRSRQIVLLSEAAGARQSAERIAADRDRYEQALQDLARRSRRTMVHKEMRIVYQIGERSRGDTVVESYVTAALDHDNPLLWLHVNVGASNSGPDRRSSFRDLEDVRVFEVHPGGLVSKLRYLPAGKREGDLWAIIFFDPEIGVSPRSWRLTYRWDGAWDPLRRTYRDSARLRLGEDHRAEHELVTVTFVFPATARGPRVRTQGYTPNLEPLIESDLHGRPQFTYELRRPGRQNYEWALEVDGFEKLGER